MFERLIRTDDHLSPFFVRLALAVVIWPHGAQKVLGWWHGNGPARTIEFFNTAWGIPPFVTVLVMLAEFVGPVLLLAGLLGRFAAVAIGLVMVGAIYFDTGKWGFFMNWYGQPRGEGFEFHILVFGMVAALLAGGSGRWSVDRMLTRRGGYAEPGYAPGYGRPQAAVRRRSPPPTAIVSTCAGSNTTSRRSPGSTTGRAGIRRAPSRAWGWLWGRGTAWAPGRGRSGWTPSSCTGRGASRPGRCRPAPGCSPATAPSTSG